MKQNKKYFRRSVVSLVLAVFIASLGTVFSKPNVVEAAPPDLSLSRIPWEGGSAYWQQFTKSNAAGWDDPNFFPISVFLSHPSDAQTLKDAGINTYAGANTSSALTNITDKGMYVIAQGNWLGPGEWTTGQVGSNPGVVGWMASDECEMGFSECEVDVDNDTDIDEDDRLAKQQEYVDLIDGFNDGRFTMANFGNGVLRTFWAPNTMSDHVQLMDMASADKYAYTSPNVRFLIDNGHDAPDWPDGTPTERAYTYGWLIDQMKRFQDSGHLRPIWAVVEAGMPILTEPGAREILPDEIEGAVWSSLIHEARGITYFQHSNGTTCSGYAIIDCPSVQTKVTAINAKIKSLAPVLNSQSYYNDTYAVNGHTYHRYTFSNGTDTMLKTYNGSAYIFAGLGMGHSTGSKTFTLPAGVNGSTVTVVGENRTIPVNTTNHTFSDTFAAEYSHHVYQVTQGITSTDYDGDTILDSVEDAAPNNGDANGDGTQDSLQASVSTIANPVSGGYNALQVSGDCDTTTEFGSAAESGMSLSDTGHDYPLGLWNFSLSCDSPGDTAQVTLFLDKLYNTAQWVYKKFNINTQAYSTIPVTFGTATVGSGSVTTISFSVQDGGPLDEDGAADGEFQDPSGPALAPGVAVVTSSSGSSQAPQTGLPPNLCSGTLSLFLLG